jgi:antitoxin (DNA-binding transcriptional repressor) of toxin-antitoxin stability system
MPIDFGLISMTELRNGPGEILDRVANGEAFIIERSGHRKACLVPLTAFVPDISPSRIAAELEELLEHGEKPKTSFTDNHELAFRLQSGAAKDGVIDLRIVMPHGYPNTCPRVYTDLEAGDIPHRWHDGALCLYGVMTGWNPGKHTIFSTLTLARRWLLNYGVWRKTGRWPDENGVPCG